MMKAMRNGTSREYLNGDEFRELYPDAQVWGGAAYVAVAGLWSSAAGLEIEFGHDEQWSVRQEVRESRAASRGNCGRCL